MAILVIAIKVTLIFTDFRALWKYSALKTLRSWRKETLSGENYDVVHHQQQLTTCDTFSQTAIKSNCFHFLLQKTRDVVAQIFGKMMLQRTMPAPSSSATAATEINLIFSANLDMMCIAVRNNTIIFIYSPEIISYFFKYIYTYYIR